MQERDGEHEAFPSEPQADDPDAEGSAGVGEAARRRADVPRHAQPEEVEQADADRDRDAAPKDGRRVEHLREPAREVEERLVRRRERGAQDGEERHHEDDGQRAEKALPADRDQRRHGVAGHDLLWIRDNNQSSAVGTVRRREGHTLNDELRCRTGNKNRISVTPVTESKRKRNSPG